MKERAILFSAPMIMAIMAGTKTQTRRIVDILKFGGINETHASRGAFECKNGLWQSSAGRFNVWSDPRPCPYGVPSDVLRVKEAAWIWCERKPNGKTKAGRPRWHYVPMKEAPVWYCADHPAEPAPDVVSPATGNKWGWRKKIGRFLPAWAVRIKLKLKSVRVERVRDIDEAGVIAEGVKVEIGSGAIEGEKCFMFTTNSGYSRNARHAFENLWNSINGERASWDSNPWVWVLEFERMK